MKKFYLVYYHILSMHKIAIEYPDEETARREAAALDDVLYDFMEFTENPDADPETWKELVVWRGHGKR